MTEHKVKDGTINQQKCDKGNFMYRGKINKYVTGKIVYLYHRTCSLQKY